MELVDVDILGPFPTTDYGNHYVLVAMDYFTKWPEVYAVPDQSAATTANRLVCELFSRLGSLRSYTAIRGGTLRRRCSLSTQW